MIEAFFFFLCEAFMLRLQRFFSLSLSALTRFMLYAGALLLLAFSHVLFTTNPFHGESTVTLALAFRSPACALSSSLRLTETQTSTHKIKRLETSKIQSYSWLRQVAGERLWRECTFLFLLFLHIRSSPPPHTSTSHNSPPCAISVGHSLRFSLSHTLQTRTRTT